MYPGLFLEGVWKGKPRKVTTSGRKRRRMRKIERHVNLTWSGWPITNGWITMRATTSWHAKIWQRWWWWWLLWRLAWWSWKLLAYMNIQENKILHLNCVNFFWSSKKWFGPVKVLPLLDQNVQWSPKYLWNDCDARPRRPLFISSPCQRQCELFFGPSYGPWTLKHLRACLIFMAGTFMSFQHI